MKFSLLRETLRILYLLIFFRQIISVKLLSKHFITIMPTYFWFLNCLYFFKKSWELIVISMKCTFQIWERRSFRVPRNCGTIRWHTQRRQQNSRVQLYNMQRWFIRHCIHKFPYALTFDYLQIKVWTLNYNKLVPLFITM